MPLWIEILCDLFQAAGRQMNLTDAIIALLLAARIHGTDQAVRTTAKIVVKKLPRGKREMIYKVIDSKKPLLMVE